MASTPAVAAGRVLIIDGEPEARERLELQLTAQGYSVSTAPDGLTGLELIESDTYDVVLSEVRVQGLGGLDLLRKARTLDPDLQVVMTTGDGTIDLAVECMRLGAFDFLQKPLELDRIVPTLQRAVEARRLRVANSLFHGTQEMLRCRDTRQVARTALRLAAAQFGAHAAAITVDLNGASEPFEESWSIDGSSAESRVLARVRAGSNAAVPIRVERAGDVDELLLISPIVRQETTLGTLVLARRSSLGAIGPSELEWSRILISHLALALENAALVEWLSNEVLERGRAEEARRISEASFRAMFEGAAIGLAFADPQGVVFRANPSFTRLFGGLGSPLELSSRVGHASPGLADLFARVVGGDVDQGSTCERLQTPEGNALWAHVTIAPVKNDSGQLQFAVVTAEDISATRDAEEERAASEQRMRALLDAIPDMMFRIHSDGRLLDFKGRFRPEDPIQPVVGANIRDLNLPPELQDEISSNVRRAISSGHLTACEHALDTPTRREYFEVRYVKSGPEEAVCIVRNITSRRNAQEQLIQAREAALEGSRIKSQFLANMSHEIRTPLNGIIGMATLALASELSAEQREYIETLHSSANSLLGVVNDILDLSKIEAGKLELAQVDFDLWAVLDETLQIFAAVAQAKGIELVCQSSKEVACKRTGDPTRVRQVLANLISNAVKFTGQGSVSVRVQRGASDELVEVSVADTGIGISAGAMSKLFAPFTQADFSSTRKYGGTGLGLSISKNLIELMGGEISAESEPGSGSTFRFTVRLPVTAGAIEPAASCSRLAGKELLVVEANPTQQQALVSMLREHGAFVTAVSDAGAALATLKARAEANRPFAAVLVDLLLSGTEGGMEVGGCASRDPALAATKRLLLTPPGRFLAESVWAEAGFSGAIPKPAFGPKLAGALCATMSATEVSAPASGPAPGVAPTGARLRVLLAEDNVVNQKIARRYLEKLGHEVLIATNGRIAAEIVKRQIFDLVLMDLQMPVADGFEATRRIREHEEGHGDRVPIIALTAHAMHGDEARCLAAGMDGYLSKPLMLDDLAAQLARFAPRPRDATSGRARPRTASLARRTVEDETR